MFINKLSSNNSQVIQCDSGDKKKSTFKKYTSFKSAAAVNEKETITGKPKNKKSHTEITLGAVCVAFAIIIDWATDVFYDWKADRESEKWNIGDIGGTEKAHKRSYIPFRRLFAKFKKIA